MSGLTRRNWKEQCGFQFAQISCGLFFLKNLIMIRRLQKHCFVPLHRFLFGCELRLLSCHIRTMIGINSSSRQRARAASAQLVTVEGNIGVGKSTLACQLARTLNFRLFLEPTTRNPYLAKFYQDPKKYALKLQLWIFKQRFRTYVEATRHLLKTGWRCFRSFR